MSIFFTVYPAANELERATPSIMHFSYRGTVLAYNTRAMSVRRRFA